MPFGAAIGSSSPPILPITDKGGCHACRRTRLAKMRGRERDRFILRPVPKRLVRPPEGLRWSARHALAADKEKRPKVDAIESPQETAAPTQQGSAAAGRRNKPFLGTSQKWYHLTTFSKFYDAFHSRKGD